VLQSVDETGIFGCACRHVESQTWRKVYTNRILNDIVFYRLSYEVHP